MKLITLLRRVLVPVSLWTNRIRNFGRNSKSKEVRLITPISVNAVRQVENGKLVFYKKVPIDRKEAKSVVGGILVAKKSDIYRSNEKYHDDHVHHSYHEGSSRRKEDHWFDDDFDMPRRVRSSDNSGISKIEKVAEPVEDIDDLWEKVDQEFQRKLMNQLSKDGSDPDTFKLKYIDEISDASQRDFERELEEQRVNDSKYSRTWTDTTYSNDFGGDSGGDSGDSGGGGDSGDWDD